MLKVYRVAAWKLAYWRALQPVGVTGVCCCPARVQCRDLLGSDTLTVGPLSGGSVGAVTVRIHVISEVSTGLSVKQQKCNKRNTLCIKKSLFLFF